MNRTIIGLLAAVYVGIATPASAVTFGFDALAPTNAQVPLAITSAGLTARFSSPTGAGAFIAQDGSAFATLGTAVLANDNFAPEELDISFSAGLKSIAFAFATNDGGSPTAVTLTATSRGVRVGSVTVTGALAASGLPEGQLSFTNLFDAVAITDTDPNNFGFAIGAVTAQVPEPASLVLVATGLVGLAARRRR